METYINRIRAQPVSYYFTNKHKSDNVLNITFSQYYSLPNVNKLFLVLFQIERTEIKSKVFRNQVEYPPIILSNNVLFIYNNPVHFLFLFANIPPSFGLLHM